MFGLRPIQKNGAFQKDLVADNEWSPYKSFSSMGTIMKFVINMEVLDADLERI
jgi:hypothetical protein